MGIESRKSRLPLTCFCLALLALLAAGCHGSKLEEATLPEVNRAVQAMTMGRGFAPTNVLELTNYLGQMGKSLPTPPAGKKLIIDPASNHAVFVEQ